MRLIDADALIDYLQIMPIDLGYREVEEIEEYVRSMPTIEPQQKWIPCSERLPEANEIDEEGFCMAYLVQDGRWMSVARWDGEYWIVWGFRTVLDNVTAWMPLPEPYKGDEHD